MVLLALMLRVFLFICTIILFSGCTESAGDDGVFRIVTTTGMLGDIAESIAGEKAEVTSLMGPGVDPHLYKATQGDLKHLKQADVIIYNGLHLEGKMGEVLEKVARFPNKVVIPAAEVVDTSNLILIDEKNEIYDPHIWFDVALWSETIKPIEEAICAFDPENKTYYQQNAVQKRTELIQLHRWVNEQIQTIPQNQRILITAHDAFAYFGKAYDIRVRGLQGISTVAEAGIRDVTSLVDLLVNEEIKAVFVESSVPKKTIEAVVVGAEEKGHDVLIGGTLYSDAMGAKGTPEGTYDGMVRSNIHTIVDALK